MNLFPKDSLQRKQLSLVMLASGVALLMACLAFAVDDFFALRRGMVANLSALAATAGNSSKAALDSRHVETAAKSLSALRANPNIKAACFYDRNGEVLAVFDRIDAEILTPPKTVPQEGHSFSKNSLHLSRKIMQGNELVGTIYLTSDLKDLYWQLQRYAVLAICVFFISCLVSLLLSARLQRLVSKPIVHLMQVTRAVTRDKNYSLRATKQTDDDLGMLVENFNEMLAEIQSRDAELQKSKDALEERVRERTQELANSVSLLSATLEATAEGILVTDAKGEISNFNDHFIQMWQIPREVAETRDNRQMIEIALAQLNDADEFQAKVVELLGKPEGESFDTLEFKDGKIFERYSKPLQAGQNYTGRVWSFRNVTGRKRAESALQRMEALYRRAIAGADAVPYSYDYKTRSYLFIGEGIQNLIGYSPEEVNGDLWKRIIQESAMSGETAGMDKDEAARRVQTGEILNWRCDMRVVTRDGRIRWLSDAAVQNRNEHGKSIGSMGILQDITERKEAEQALREQDEKFHQLADNVTDVFWIRSPDLQKLHYVSPAFEKIWGRPMEELYSNPQLWISVIFPEDRERVVAAFSQLTKNTPDIDIEYRITRSDGDIRWIRARGFQVRDASGQLVRLSGIVTDITERKQMDLSASAFSRLGQDLSSAAAPEAAARIIGDVSSDLIGWDACYVQLYSEEDDIIHSILNVDTIDGQRAEKAPFAPRKATSFHTRILKSGGELILRDDLGSFLPGAAPFGDQSRPSASLMFVPIRYRGRSIGILSIQSYTPKAYDEQDLRTLQMLADQCAGSLERIWADEARRRSEMQFRLVWDTSADGMRLSDENGNVVMANDAYCRMVGKSKAEIENHPLSIIHSTENAEFIQSKHREEIAARSFLPHLEKEIQLWNGKKIWFELSNSILELPEQPPMLLSVFRDITERKQAEILALTFSKLGQNLSLAASPREAARTISEVSDDLIGWDACSLQLYSEDDDTIYSVFEIDTADGKRMDSTFNEMRKATELHHRILNVGGELILRDESQPALPGAIGFGNKSRRSASILYVPIRYRERRVGILSVHSYTANAYDEQDLRTLQTLADQCGGTLERIRADDAFRKSESQFRLVWNTSSDGMRLSDENGNVVMANDAYCRMVGKSKAEIENHPLSIIHSTENAEFIQSKHREEIAARSFLPHLEKEIQLWNGKKIWFELSNSILELPEQPPMLLNVFRDITFRKASDEALRKTEELYRRAIGGAGAVPYACDYLTNNYLFMGEQIEALIGYAPHEVTGALWKQIIQESIMIGDAEGLNKTEAGNQVLAGEIQQWRCDMRVITKEGKSRWLSDTSVQTLDETGRVVGSMGILQDITERKHAEISALAFSKLGKNLSSAASPEHAAKIISEVAEELLGWDACYVQMCSESNDHIYSLFDADTVDGKRITGNLSEAQKLSPLHQRILKSGAELILRDDVTTFSPGGNPFGNTSRPSVSLMYVPIRSEDRSIGILSIQSYNTNAYDDDDLKTLQTLADQCGGALQRIRAGEAMRKSESQFRLVWDTSADGMRLANRDGIVLLANDAYCRMVDKSREEIEGQSLSIIHQKQNIEKILRKHREQVDSRSAQAHLETEVVLWNGKKIWFELSNSLLELPGQPMLILSIFRDITQRKQSETELEAIHHQLLDTSRQAGMAEVATSVLHNVGNVLNSVNVSGSLIREKVKKSRVTNLNKIAAIFQEHDGGLPEFFATDPKGKQLPAYLSQLAAHLDKEQQEVLQEIGSLVNNIEHIKEIVAMQQSYSKVSGMSESLQIIDLVEDALRMNAGALDRHQVQVIREYSQAPHVLVEKHKVLQILINLIRNAKYACDEAKRTDKQIKVRVTNDETHLDIAIIDNGIGIPPENLTRIFNHGFTTRKEGHGYGLHSGALAAIEIGGSLNAHSEGTGKGAAFTLRLPVKT